MKKYLGFMIVSLLALLPFTVKATSSIDYDCQSNENGTKTCVVTHDFDEEYDTATVTLTEEGGAEITSVEGMDNYWTIQSDKEGSTWTVTATSPGVDGTGQLFKFTYNVSGTEDCSVIIEFEGSSRTITDDPVEPEPEIPVDPDTPTEQKQTGSTLPFVALGVIALIAGGAYISTKSKSKMYRL